MLRLPTAAIISIVTLLSIARISDARSIKRTSTDQLSRQSKPSALAKQSKIPNRTISGSDLSSIQKVISDHYARKNQLLESISSRSRRFYEVESLKLVSFSNTKAQIEVEENIRGYDFLNARYVSNQKLDLVKNSESGHTKHTFNISLKKLAGKWKINTRLNN
ncbi:MAG: hypothetical protein LH474_12675 [Chamaesiphon sp.]|nr:hypothetical protein [Chamaesiphon sp.]